MEQILKQFVKGSLYEASSQLLSHLHIIHTQEDPAPMLYEDYYDGTVPQYVQQALRGVKALYYIGEVCDDSLAGIDNNETLREDIEKLKENSHYQSMFLFAVDLPSEAITSRSDMSVLTRAFNRLVCNFPVTVIFRQGQMLSIATCERTEYKQEWRQNQGEKVGKVHILRNIDCQNTHRGHLDILQSLNVSDCRTFDALYAKWLKVFNSEVLTKKFYDDLFEWYQWAVNPATKVSFPGNADTQSDDREDIDTRVIRLITRIMFVWFIKQKGLVPDKIFQRDYIGQILKNFDPESATECNYYQGILQNLFFGTLNRPVIDEDGTKRGFATNGGKEVTNLYRYGSTDKDGGLFSVSDETVVELFSTVPYLNCGLFDCLDKTKSLDGVERRYYNDGFSRNPAKFADGTYRYRAVVPNVLFFKPEKGLLSIFERYVFTIEENTPQDVQVALDPELLGKVFENLLGAYNPETKETARNQSGSFYTPREIVQYMVNESLVAHLNRIVGKELEPKYRELLDFSTDCIDLTIEQRRAIMHALVTCKVLDPACGSGAFPMGMLQQMVHILQQVDPDNEQWREVLLNMAVDESRKAFGLADEEERKKKLREIEETFNANLKSPDYTRKLYLIESCIYGVDIQPIAMLITRLRFFITLVCEQQDIQLDRPENNFGIKTLPNLESKFVAANSLIDADIHQYNEDWTNNEELSILKNELIAIRRRHFYTRKRSEKMRLLKEDKTKRDQIHKLINILVGEPNLDKIEQCKATITRQEALLPQYLAEDWVMVEVEEQPDLFSPVEKKIIRKDLNKAKRDEIQTIIKRNKEAIEKEYHKSTPTGFEAAVLQVTDWNPYDQNTVSPFLDIEWMFGMTDGFDIVIGNPPYIQLQADKGKLAKLYEPCGFESFLKGGDIYCLFYERGNQLLRKGGLLTYITSNKWMRAAYGEKIRKYLTARTNPLLLIDFGETHVFTSACVMTNILMFQNGGNEYYLNSTQMKDDFTDPASIDSYVNKNHIFCKFENEDSWVIMNDTMRRIKQKVESQGIALQEWDINIYRGILTGYNPAFFITTERRNEILAACVTKEERKLTEDIIRPLLRGKDIQKYGNRWADMWLIGTFPAKKLDIEKCPAIKAHLLSFGKERLEQTGETHVINGAKIKSRKKNGNKWFETQDSIKYWKDLDKPKIMYPNMTKYLPFYYDEKKFLQNDKSFFITGTHISYLTAFLNSSLFKYCFMDNFPPLFGGSRELRKVFFDKIPIMDVDDDTNDEFHALVLDIQNEYSDEKAKAIDQKIFDLYGLTKDERDEIGYIDFHGSTENEDEDE